MSERIERIMRMEAVYDRLHFAPDREGYELLRSYYESCLWLRDYEADERGELPADLKRGVLSQDGVWELLQQLEQVPDGGRFDIDLR